MLTKIFRHFVAVAAVCLIQGRAAAAEAPTEQELSLIKAASKAFAYVAQKAIPAVVSMRVETTVQAGQEAVRGDPFDPLNEELLRQFFGMPIGPQSIPVVGQGSGCLVSPDGYILTNHHIVGRASRIEVQLTDGRQFPAHVVGIDPKSDLAVIKIDGKDLPYLKLGDSDELAIGEWAVAVGAPFGLAATVTVGVVSGKQRNQLGITDSDDFIQTDASINPGNSGGPLLNLSAEIVGINTALVSGSGTSAGVGFAIPSSMAKQVMEQLISSGKVTRGYLGITLQNVDHDLARAFGLEVPRGALVTEVLPDSPAKAASLRAGDVITELNGKAIESVTAFRNAIALMESGKRANLTVLRNGKVLNESVVVGLHPHSATGLVREAGLEIMPLTDALRKELGLASEDSGVVVSAVEPGSAAAKARLTPGALIIRVGQEPVATPQEVCAAMEALANRGECIPLLVRQGPHTRYVPLKP